MGENYIDRSTAYIVGKKQKQQISKDWKNQEQDG